MTNTNNNTRSFSSIDNFLDRQIRKRIDGYVDLYAKKNDGTIDEALATRIRWEVGRRGETGKQLDIYEPLRWTGIRAVLGVLGAATAKMITDRAKGTTKNLMWGVEIGIVVSTVINSIIDLTRLYPRWLAGLEGGKNTALKLHRENAVAPSEKSPATVKENMPQVANEDVLSEVSHSSRADKIGKKEPLKPVSLMERTERDIGGVPPHL